MCIFIFRCFSIRYIYFLKVGTPCALYKSVAHSTFYVGPQYGWEHTT